MGNCVARGVLGRVAQKHIRLGVVLSAIRGIAVVRRHVVNISRRICSVYILALILLAGSNFFEDDAGLVVSWPVHRLALCEFDQAPNTNSSSLIHTTIMGVPFDFAPERPEHMQQILDGLDRYNPETTGVFQDYVMQQCENQTYDCYANLALLKLYVPPLLNLSYATR